jgi:hypothetical protein
MRAIIPRAARPLAATVLLGAIAVATLPFFSFQIRAVRLALLAAFVVIVEVSRRELEDCPDDNVRWFWLPLVGAPTLGVGACYFVADIWSAVVAAGLAFAASLTGALAFYRRFAVEG